MSLLAAILQLPGVTWLTRVGAITRAENKLVQASVAAEVGVKSPRTIVTNEHDLLRRVFPDELVVKPLGVGHFFDDGKPYVVHAREVQAHAISTPSLAVAPFLLQQKLTARRHWRVVTVADDVWSACLTAGELPLDWRRDELAHTSFAAASPPAGLEVDALTIATTLNLGYSSQDWIESDDGVYLVDVNPSGQWLFLPEPIASGVASAIAGWLEGGGRND